jgi:thiol:disulfide interchange protein
MLRLRQLIGFVLFAAVIWLTLLALHAIPELIIYMITGRN